ncbi:MAG TPA: hypothetical protein PLY04_18055 [bacterium]|nr:hypothetical protein [bacterium]
MRNGTYITSKTAGFNYSNPMAVALRSAMAKHYGFTSSDDPFEFQRHLIEAKAKAIAAEMEAKHKERETEKPKVAKAAELAANQQAQTGDTNQAHKNRQRPENNRVFAGGIAPLSARKKQRESTADAIRRLNHLLEMAEARDQRRKYGKWGRAYINANAPESDYAALRRQHQTRPELRKEIDVEREQIIDELQRLNAFAGEFMLAYDVYELRRTLRRAKKLRGIADGNTSAIQSSKADKPLRFDGFTVGEDERERVAFTIRRMRAQLPMNWEYCSLYELLNHLRTVCIAQGRKWFSELWPTSQPFPAVLPTVVKTEIIPEPKPEPVNSAVERLWLAIFGSLGAGN